MGLDRTVTQTGVLFTIKRLYNISTQDLRILVSILMKRTGNFSEEVFYCYPPSHMDSPLGVIPCVLKTHFLGSVPRHWMSSNHNLPKWNFVVCFWHKSHQMAQMGPWTWISLSLKFWDYRYVQPSLTVITVFEANSQYKKKEWGH